MQISILENIFQASPSTVSRENTNVPMFHRGTNKWNDIFVPTLSNLKNKYSDRHTLTGAIMHELPRKWKIMIHQKMMDQSKYRRKFHSIKLHLTTLSF